MSDNKEIAALVDRITTSGRKDIEKDSFEEFKRLCKQGGDQVVEQVFHMLVYQMTRNHSQIRYCTLLLINELFLRSHYFRTLLLKSQNLQEFFEAFLGINARKPLPPPKAWRCELKKKCIECIDVWYNKFKDAYPSLNSAYKHFKSTCIDFRERQIITDEEKREKEAENERRKELLIKKMHSAKLEFMETKNLCDELLNQIFNCFQLLFPWLQRDDIFSCEEFFETPSSQLTNTKHDISITIKPFIEIVENQENSAIVQNLKDICNQLTRRCLVQLKNNLKKMTEGSDFCQTEIKQAIDLKCAIINALQKFIKLKIVSTDESKETNSSSSSSDDDDDEFEEVEEKEDIELIIPQHRRKEYGLDMDDKSPNLASTSTSDTHLMCKFRLPNGKLCPRKDAIKCPFHGKIIPRDEMGIPLCEEDRQKELNARKSDVPEWQDPTLLKEIEAAIGIDLTVKKRGRIKSKEKNSLLQDLKTCDDTPRKRLKRKIFTKDAQERIARDLDKINERRAHKYSEQWNYALEN